ncbi:MAG: hypothetical protein HYT34_01895, partial [Candidatus Ryanbacteria bacterium]|nr:hypothetical protein [Candidatus Ryanbacteria bacterium]
MKREGDPTEEEALKDLGNPADSSEKNNPETGGEKGMSDNPKDEEDALLRALGKAQKRPAEAGTKKLTKAEDKLLSELGKPKKEGEISDAARRIREKREEIREPEQEIALAKKTGRRKAREGREQPVEEATNLQEYILYAFDDGEHTLLDVSGLNPQERNAKTQAYEAGIVHTRKFLKERVSMTEEEARFWEESEPIREELMSFWEEFRRADTEEEAREKLGKVRDVLGRLDQLREEIFGSKYISSS